MLGGFAEVAVTFHAETLQELDGGLGSLGEAMFRTKVDCEDGHDWMYVWALELDYVQGV